MSAIPPNAIGSVLQSGIAQDVQSRDTQRIDNERKDATRSLTGAGSDVIEIEQTDTGDTQVNPDTMGAGGQGRHDAPPDEDATGDDTQSRDGVTFDDDGRPHLDISA